MILLNQGLTPERKVPLESMSLILKERDSTATITPADMTGIQMKSWLQDDTDPGKGIVWRVKSIRTNYNTDTSTIQLEHIISTLKDRILFGERKTEDVAGQKGAQTVSAKKAVQYILSHQSDWELGTFGYNVSNPYKFDGENLYDAIELVTDSLEDAVWTYDMTVYPFKLNITQADDTAGSEMRAGRNLRTINKNVDKSGMYTRFYPIGKNDLHLPGAGYVEMNADKYGVHDKVETDQTLATEAELRRWATERLRKHAEPTVTIDIEGYELADATGEPMDRLKLCRGCRVPLPEFGTEILERITTLNYPEKLRQPEVVKVTMANNRNDLTKIIAENMKRGGGGGRASARQSKEDHAWFEDTDHHVAMCAEGIVGVDSTGEPNWWRLSQIIVDENGIDATVKSVQGRVTVAETRINQNENAISLEAEKRTAENKLLVGRLEVTSQKVGMIVGTKNGEDYIKAGEIAIAINESTGASEAIIDAEHVYIGNQKSTTVINGKATVQELNAVKASFDNLTAGTSTATWLKASSMAADSFTANNSLRLGSYTATWRLLQYTDHNGSNAEMYVLGRSAG